jgi:hypothetical protein
VPIFSAGEFVKVSSCFKETMERMDQKAIGKNTASALGVNEVERTGQSILISFGPVVQNDRIGTGMKCNRISNKKKEKWY